ncbi:hypothetical protein Nepgr_033394 [Nepenthes gracilis]|uniref:Uncharacterized protein n=1 Tax=Nepenthes gracilis TaxID=150966 RepID=A0AAD3TKE1_NEPGR|nr:hypothetical protein Nepgr_033394 [Nepenthes gracilis]
MHQLHPFFWTQPNILTRHKLLTEAHMLENRRIVVLRQPKLYSCCCTSSPLHRGGRKSRQVILLPHWNLKHLKS